jgi:hypothetical protein
MPAEGMSSAYSWMMKRARRVQVSRVVSAKAETVSATKETATATGMPIAEMKPPSPSEKRVTGPASTRRAAKSPRVITATAITAMTASRSRSASPRNRSVLHPLPC